MKRTLKSDNFILGTFMNMLGLEDCTVESHFTENHFCSRLQDLENCKDLLKRARV